MAMTGQGLIDEVRDNIRRTSFQIPDTRILRWVNWGQEKVADTHTFEEMRKIYTGDTAASSTSYGFPTRMKDIFSLRVVDGTNDRKLVYVPAREMDMVEPRPATDPEDVPTWYVDYGVNFELVPVPDAIYPLRLRCSVYPTDLTVTAVSQLLRKDRLMVVAGTVFGGFGAERLQ